MNRIVPPDTANLEVSPIKRLSNRVAASVARRRIIRESIELIA
jgi:hypothetical protein